MKTCVNKLALAIALSLIFALAPRRTAVAAEFAIHDGDRVVFLGDSITEQRLYTTYIEAYALTRHPNWNLSFRNVGWGGDTSWLRQRFHPDEKKLFAADADTQQKMVEDAVRRGLARDVLPLKPTFVTIKFGMNDHSYQAFREDIFNAYVRSQAELVKELTGAGARVVFLTPQPIEEKRPDPDKDVRNESLRKFSDGLKEVAEKAHAGFVDQFDPYMKIMLHERASNPNAMIGGGDAVHPGPIGHTIMAWAILKGMGASALVSRAEIDAAGHKVGATEGCKITNLKFGNETISFDRLDDALPMPIDERAEAALKLAPILDDLDRYELRITGLGSGTRQVFVDGQLAVDVSTGQLANGFNLANSGGPAPWQAREVLRLIFEKNNAFFHRWRDIQLYSFPSWANSPELESKRAAELSKIDQEIADLEDKIQKARQPKSHHFEIMRSSP